MKRFRIVDLPMIVKIGFAPALAMALMVLLSANSVQMLQRQAESLQVYNEKEIPLTRGIQNVAATMDEVQSEATSMIIAAMSGAPPADAETRRQAMIKDLEQSSRQTLDLKGLAPADQFGLLDTAAAGQTDAATLLRGIDFRDRPNLSRSARLLETQHARNQEVFSTLTAKGRANRTASADERMERVKTNQTMTIQLTLAAVLAIALLAGLAVLNVRRSVAPAILAR